MKLFAPKNIFTSLLVSVLPEDIQPIYKSSSLLSKELEINTTSVALIPSLDIIKNRNLFVSNKIAISFDGLLSNSYLYFAENKKDIEKVFLKGDVSLNEIFLSKILFDEKFASNVELSLETSETVDNKKDYILVGDDNFYSNNFKRGMSFAEEIADILELPYVNFVLASPDREALQNFERAISSLDDKIEDEIQKILNSLAFSEDFNSFIVANLNSVYYQMTENEVDALSELIKLVYYYGIIDDVFDVKFSQSI